MGEFLLIDGNGVDELTKSFLSYLPVGTEVGSKPETKDGYETLKVYQPLSPSLHYHLTTP